MAYTGISVSLADIGALEILLLAVCLPDLVSFLRQRGRRFGVPLSGRTRVKGQG